MATTARHTDNATQQQLKHDRQGDGRNGRRAPPNFPVVVLSTISILYVLYLCINVKAPAPSAPCTHVQTVDEIAFPRSSGVRSVVTEIPDTDAAVPELNGDGNGVVKEGSVVGGGDEGGDEGNNVREGVPASMDGVGARMGTAATPNLSGGEVAVTNGGDIVKGGGGRGEAGSKSGEAASVSTEEVVRNADTATSPTQHHDDGRGTVDEVIASHTPQHSEADDRSQALGDHFFINPGVELPNQSESRSQKCHCTSSGSHSSREGTEGPRLLALRKTPHLMAHAMKVFDQEATCCGKMRSCHSPKLFLLYSSAFSARTTM